MDFIHITSAVEAYQDVTVSAEESGVIKEFFVDKGQVLRRGQAIAKLKDDVLVTQLAEAQAAANLAREQFKRQKVLWQRDNIGSELAYLQAKSSADVSNARVNLLKIRLSNTTVKAPINGIFEEKFLETGEMATPGQPIIRLINTDQVRITGGVPERYALFVHPGDSAWITFDFLPGQEYVGLINFVGNAVDNRSRTFPIEIVLDNPHRSIKPQMVAGVNLVREHLDNVITVPRQIVMRLEDGYQLYVAQEFQGKLVAAARRVRLGPNHENRVVVQAGLEVGELIITLGYQQVDHGTPIRVINASSLVLATEKK
jgi:RND family efflux transporter MFP subunit